MHIIKQNARTLRKNPTEAEQKLWKHLKSRQLNNLKFRRQVPIDSYIVDFLCFEKRIIIEVDGGQHGTEPDKARTEYLESKGFLVLRFWNNEILGNIEGVLQEISETCKITSPS